MNVAGEGIRDDDIVEDGPTRHESLRPLFRGVIGVSLATGILLVMVLVGFGVGHVLIVG